MANLQFCLRALLDPPPLLVLGAEEIYVVVVVATLIWFFQDTQPFNLRSSSEVPVGYDMFRGLQQREKDLAKDR